MVTIWNRPRPLCLFASILMVLVGLTMLPGAAQARAPEISAPDLIERALAETEHVDVATLAVQIDVAAVAKAVTDAAVDAGLVTPDEAADVEISTVAGGCEPGGDPLSFLIRAVFCIVFFYVNEVVGDVNQALDFILNDLLPLLLCLTFGPHPCF